MLIHEIPIRDQESFIALRAALVGFAVTHGGANSQLHTETRDNVNS